VIKTSRNRHQVVIVGAGFGGLEAATHLEGVDVDVTIIDRRNYHLFQPLLYQVAGASLSPSEIAWPIRYLFRDRPEVRTLMAEVEGVDKAARQVILQDGTRYPYDTLVLATGATHAYFGHDEWSKYAPGLKSLEDATTIRGRILSAFEQAELCNDPEVREALQTFVIIGGGPTGVELAGTIAELARGTLQDDFRSVDPSKTRVFLIEAGPRLLPVFPEKLSEYTRRALEKLGVSVLLGAPVTECASDGVMLNGKKLAASTIVWAAGVQASPAARWLDTESDRAGRAIVGPDLTVPGSPNIFVIGDTASSATADGKTVPGIAPAAKQQGKYVAGQIEGLITGARRTAAFKYRHQGNLATIGRSLAVIDMGKLKLSGGIAWWIWKLAHIYFLIGVRNRLSVAMSWVWNHSVGYRGARIILREKASNATSGSLDGKLK
jgi:NADH dehydrogenase